ncbi:hypothetical protein CONPUDRAFT_68674 [Coniophora puteana RWD-64-598 SS2]|uniref:F-box domain-containing protein n=1 Tax=Coniophora puteana (strain RWD-64-598) TaxID=741705 RepID=A0A5M3N572_CONPW|nr:uncharacterized protein CONPUDRAFT_68674 [Coniophora puteana RWD-64-598 SS2]EIW86061.1 hypothetical protein CONPUDRAFT_68674 [Coniophora puteana RWD-64-598 SS2]
MIGLDNVLPPSQQIMMMASKRPRTISPIKPTRWTGNRFRLLPFRPLEMNQSKKSSEDGLQSLVRKPLLCSRPGAFTLAPYLITLNRRVGGDCETILLLVPQKTSPFELARFKQLSGHFLASVLYPETRDSMHPNPLHIDEIITNVLSFVREPDLSGDDAASPHRDLAVMARVCRSVSEPALDVLWSDLSSLFPLLRCLPNDLITYYPSTSRYSRGTAKFELRRRIKCGDWKIFFKYAARVVNLCANSAGAECIPPKLYLALCIPFTLNAFPKLRSLHWVESPETSAIVERCMFMRQLLVPSIVDLNLDFVGGAMTPHVLSLVSILGAVCPNVKVVRFASQDISDKAAGAFSDAICSWTALEDVQCHTLSFTGLRHLSSLASLRSLSVEVPDFPPYPRNIWGTPNDQVFSGIHSFTFVSDSSVLSSIAKLVNSLQQRRLSPKKFTAVAKLDSGEGDAMVHLFDSILNTFDRDALTDLTVAENATSSLSFVNPDSFRYILPFHNLAFVNIKSGRKVLMKDSTLLQLADAWPNLASLAINQECGWRIRSKISLHGLREMLQRLPRLVYLAIAVDGATVCPRDVEVNNLGQFSIYRPFTLDLLDSRIGKNVREVAGFLADMFPLHEIGRDDRTIHAWQIQSDSAETGENANLWESVVRTVGIINKVSLKRLQTQLRFNSDGDYDNDGAYDIDGMILRSV